MFRSVLVAFDGSAQARKAYLTALDIAQKYQAEVHVLAVARAPDFAVEVETRAEIERARDHLNRRFAFLQSETAHVPLRPHFRIAVGHPAEQIVRAAEERRIELILLGHRGHGVFERWLLGSVSRTVIAYAHCAVMIVR